MRILPMWHRHKFATAFLCIVKSVCRLIFQDASSISAIVQGSWGHDPAEPVELRGMLYHDGIDSLGRPVIVINSDAVAANVSRSWACQYMMQRLEPIVSQVCFAFRGCCEMGFIVKDVHCL